MPVEYTSIIAVGCGTRSKTGMLFCWTVPVSAWFVIRCADLCRVWICAHGLCCGREVQPSHFRETLKARFEECSSLSSLRSCHHMCCPKAMIGAEMRDFTLCCLKTSCSSFVLWRDLDGLCDSSVYSWNLGSHVHGRERVSPQTSNESHATVKATNRNDTLETAEDVTFYDDLSNTYSHMT